MAHCNTILGQFLALFPRHEFEKIRREVQPKVHPRAPQSTIGHLAKPPYSSGESFSVDFFALSASPRLPVERVMG